MMKATKLISMIAIAGLGLFAQGALAQTNKKVDTSNDAPPIDNNEAPPIIDENAAPAVETQPYNESVTIDNGANGGTGTSSAAESSQPEKKERLRVYSGKQDGNNVIVDPR